MASKKKITHTRIYKDTVMDFSNELPGVNHADIIRMSWQMWKGVQKAGKIIYGKKIWKTPKKR